MHFWIHVPCRALSPFRVKERFLRKHTTTTDVYWYTIHVSSSASIHGQFLSSCTVLHSKSSFALWYAWGGIRVLYVVALATFDLATARAGASRGVGKRRR